MNERKKVEERLKRKEQEIQTLESQIKDARVYIQALNDVLKLLPKGPTEDAALRPGSTVAQARDVIMARRKPLHINDILTAMSREATRDNSASLGSQLAAYVRREEIFTRPAPNTFGLIELGHSAPVEPPEQEPPPGFGKLPAEEEDGGIPF
jgi:hypothetical protein